MAIKQKWECHKTVEAFKVIEVQMRSTLDRGNQCVLVGADGQGEVVDAAWCKRHAPTEALHPDMFVDGYFVRYSNGHTSWSPAKAFEEGYTELKDENNPS
jgi:hypothetical protein